jgi:hypothetical protein
MGGYFSVTDGSAGKEVRTIDAEAIGATHSSPRTAGYFFAQNCCSGTGALNQAIYAQSATASATTTNDYTLRLDSPSFTGGTMSNHTTLQIEDATVGGASNPNPIAINVVAGKTVLGGALTVAGVTTLSNLASAGTQCLQASTTGIISGTGTTCGSGGSGSVITVNGGAALGSPTNFQNGSAVTGITINFSNPSGNNVAATISGTLTNAGLANSSITLNGTANQITSPGLTSLGGTATFAIATNPILPGKTTLTASTTSLSALNIPSGVAPTSPGSGDFWNQSGILHFFDSVNNNSLVTIQAPLVNGHIPKANGTNGLISDGYGVQGSGSNLITSGTIAGPTGTPLCTDSTGAVTTSSCLSTDLSGMVASGVPIAATANTITSSLNSSVAGQTLTFQNGSAPTATSPSLLDSVNSPVTSASYTLACDTATAIVDRAHLLRFQSGASAPVIPLSTATGCTGGFVAVLVDDGAGPLSFSRTGSDTFSIYDGATRTVGATTFTLQNGQYATLNQGAPAIWEILLKTTSALPAGSQGRALVNTTGSTAYATSDTYGIDLIQFAATIPFTTGGTTPTVDVTTAFNALVGALPIGSHIMFPRNAHYKFGCTAGAQACVPIQTDGLVFECPGGPGPQYSASLAATPCSLHVATAGAYIFGVGVYGNSTSPTSGPQFKNISFVDDTAKSNAGGQIKIVNTNDVIGDNLTAIGGFRQPAVSAPSAPTCTQTASGGSLPTGAVRVELEAWTTSGPSLPSAPTACSGTAPASNAGTASITIPSPVAPIIGYEALCATGGSTTAYFTCSPLPTYTTNGDGSQTINLQTATPLAVTAVTSTRQATPIDLSHTNGISCEGSIGWSGAAGFCNGPRFKNLKSYFVQGAWTCGIGGASCNLDQSEVQACDVVVATGACGSGSATPGLIIGLAGLRLTSVHESTSNSSPSTGIVAAISGFNNTIIGGTFQSNTGSSTETGISLINATGTVVKGLVLANFGTCLIADANSSNNEMDFADNGTCGTLYTDNGTANQWWEAGKLLALGPSTTATAKFNLAHGSAPTAPNNGDIWTTTTSQFNRINGVTQQTAYIASPAFTGTPTAPTPAQNDNSTKLSTTAYTDLAVANAVAGVNPAVAVLAASTANLTGTYVQVGGGIGDTFTITATGTFSLDGVALNTIGQRVLFKNQSTASQNGVYTVTVAGAVAVQPVFTRALDYDTPSDVNNTGVIPVQSGTANADTGWLLTSQVTSIGSSGSSITYTQFTQNAANVVTAATAATAANQVCVSSGATKTCTYIDLPERLYVPSANCNNTNAGAGWSIGSGGTVTCRAGTNNLGGYISITDTSSTFATFQIAIPEDWDTGSNPYIRFQIASTDATNGHTVIPSIQVACYKGDGSTTDDVAANAAHSLSTVTLNGNANRFWSTSNVQMNSTDVTGCVAGALMQITVGRATDTATNAEFYGATVTIPRLPAVQAN